MFVGVGGCFLWGFWDREFLENVGGEGLGYLRPLGPHIFFKIVGGEGWVYLGHSEPDVFCK